MEFASIKTVVAELQAGRMVVLVDDEARENEGDLIAPGYNITPEQVNFMATHGRGWICLTLEEEACKRLQLPPIAADNQARYNTAFTVTIEAREGITTGISAADRARTIRLASNPETAATELARPGHVQPIQARPGGVLVRAGQTEGSIDLMKIAGLPPAGVICEIMNEDGSMARRPALDKFCQKHGLKICSVAQIIAHRRRTENLVRCEASVKMPTALGDFDLHSYTCAVSGESHLALTVGWPRPGASPREEPLLLRVHSECLTGDLFHSLRCDCGAQLHRSMQMAQQRGNGAIIYMRQEGRGIGLLNKLKAYELQEKGFDTVDANLELGFAPDLRDYGLGAQIIRDLGIRQMELITNNPQKISALSGYGLSIKERVPLECGHHSANQQYLHAKKTRLGHMLS